MSSNLFIFIRLFVYRCCMAVVSPCFEKLG